MSTHARIEISPCDKVSTRFTTSDQDAFAIENGAALKRGIDLILALLLLPLVAVIALPILVLVSLDRGSPIYRHQRVGRGGRLFSCYKIRTMTPDAEARLGALLDNNPSARAEWYQQFKLKQDPRITRVGYFLRRTSLDELPQILNVLKGEMSFVGPRPIIVEELEKYGAACAAYLACRPGISGLWQINGRNDTSYEDRVAYDARYAQTWSPLLDLAILLRTLPVILKARGSY